VTELRVLSGADIDRSMSMQRATDVLRDAFTASGEPPAFGREHLPFADGELLVMSAVRTEPDGRSFAGVKVVTVRNDNVADGLPSVHAVFVLFGGPSLGPIALIDGAALTGFRTAAVSALATRILAREDAERLVIFGAGVQATAHLKAMAAVRPIRHVTIVNRDETRAEMLLQVARGLGIEACRGDQGSVRDADIVCTCTTSASPVFEGALLEPGSHVNAVGSYHPDVRELDDTTARRARWFVEERARVFEESGDVLMPIASGAVVADFVVADLFGLCAGAAGRTAPEDITVFKSVGLAIEDLAIATALIEIPPD
jgi:ornithine cyclodeaminase/alanine dehydrogenase-like protein (mu-crystallin family)